ncbi:PBECR2 nuclease fold domain-containing protein [Ruegeria arenilitoris]|uniref:PBECR2 nuclease fold domain-containing protein n=1 Tax=Ruegeria arenilitoris TaxID=1173585 RepID=UPI001CFE97F4|nr:PBECR2 nuclease fold domain-containing protein [Ruegeria arenilitoris]
MPEGVDFGLVYQPDNTWERGSAPLELQKPFNLTQPELALSVSPPLDQLGRSFTAPQLAKGDEPEFYVRRFLQPFDIDTGRGTVFRDRVGQAVVISDQLFRNADRGRKVLKLGRKVDIKGLTKAIFGPGEIWVVDASLGGKAGTKNESVSRLTFSIDVVLPHDKDQRSRVGKVKTS